MLRPPASDCALTRIQSWPGPAHPPIAANELQGWIRRTRMGLLLGWVAISVPVLGFSGQQVAHAFLLACWTAVTMLACWACIHMEGIIRSAIARSGRGFVISPHSAILLWKWSEDPFLRQACVRWMAVSPVACPTSHEFGLVADYVRTHGAVRPAKPIDISLHGESAEQILNRNGMRDEALAMKAANAIAACTPPAQRSPRISRF